MTPRQKRIIGALMLTNVIVIIALTILISRPAQPSGLLATELSKACRWQAAQALAEAGGSGTVKLPSQRTLAFEIDHQLALGASAEEAAQQVWIAFDAARALREINQCEGISRIEVTVQAIPSQGARQRGNAKQIRATVSRADLEAFDDGKLNEADFIDRVRYATGTAP